MRWKRCDNIRQTFEIYEHARIRDKKREEKSERGKKRRERKKSLRITGNPDGGNKAQVACLFNDGLSGCKKTIQGERLKGGLNDGKRIFRRFSLFVFEAKLKRVIAVQRTLSALHKALALCF